MTQHQPKRVVLAIVVGAMVIALAPSLSAQASTMAEKDACAYCQPVPLNKHALITEAGDDVIGQSHDPVPPTCPGPHSACPGSFAALDTPEALEIHLAKLSDAGSKEVVASLVTVLGDHAVFNAERSALQILGCEGEVIGQIPLQPELTLGLRGHVRIVS